MIQTAIDRLKQNHGYITAYSATFLYLEVLYVMFAILLVYGKFVAVTTGFVLAVVLTVHIFMLYFRFGITRKIHLVICELHAAYALSFIINSVLLENSMTMVQAVICIMRFIMFICDILLICLLTDSSVIENWK